MAIKKTWDIINLHTVNNVFGFTNVVRVINWRLTVQNDGENGTIPQIIHVDGAAWVDLPYDPNSYIPFENLSKEEILTWLKTSMGDKWKQTENEAEDLLLQILLRDANSGMTVEEKPTPWGETFSGGITWKPGQIYSSYFQEIMKANPGFNLPPTTSDDTTSE